MSEDRKFKFENGQFVNRISGKPIPDDEPVILFRARDIHTIKMLNYYKSLVVDSHHKEAVQDRIDEFTIFQNNHSDRVKEPGITRHIRLNRESGSD